MKILFLSESKIILRTCLRYDEPLRSFNWTLLFNLFIEFTKLKNNRSKNYFPFYLINLFLQHDLKYKRQFVLCTLYPSKLHITIRRSILGHDYPDRREHYGFGPNPVNLCLILILAPYMYPYSSASDCQHFNNSEQDSGL